MRDRRWWKSSAVLCRGQRCCRVRRRRRRLWLRLCLALGRGVIFCGHVLIGDVPQMRICSRDVTGTPIGERCAPRAQQCSSRVLQIRRFPVRNPRRMDAVSGLMSRPSAPSFHSPAGADGAAESPGGICGETGLATAKALDITLAICSARFVSELELHLSGQPLAKRGCAAGWPTLRAPHAAARAALKRRSIVPVGILNTKPELCRTLRGCCVSLQQQTDAG